MPTQLSKGHVFVPGEVVDPADLNELVDAGTVLKGAITEATLAAPNTPASDLVLYYNNTAGDLRKCHVSQLPSGVTTVSATIDSGASVLNFSVATPSTTPAFHIGLDNQAAGKVLAGPVSGSSDTPAFRVLSPSDLPSSTVDIAALAIDWSLGSMFKKEILVNSTFTFTNASAGQTIRVLLFQSGTSHTATWPSPMRWPGGTPPVMTPNGIDIYTFHYIGGVYYGTFDQAFAF